MGTGGRRSKGKLWGGFGLLCAFLVIWCGHVALTAQQPTLDLAWVVMGYALTGMVFFAGVIVTVLGMIEYAGEEREARRGKGDGDERG